MDQISRPMLVALIAVVGFAGVWMTVLRPKAQESGAASAQPAAAPGVGGLQRAVGKARGAVATANGANQPAPSAAPVAPGAVTPAPSPPVVDKARTTSNGGSTVLLFAGTGADDAVARSVVRSVRRPGLRVIVAGLDDVAKYKTLLGSIAVTASPTILVFGATRRAQVIEGLPDVAQVRQALLAVR